MTAPMFRTASGGGWSGTATPWMRDLLDRVILIEPIPGSFEPDVQLPGVTRKPEDKPRPGWRCNVLVLDASSAGHIAYDAQGNPADQSVLVYGGRGTGAEPHTDRISIPAYFQGVLVTNDSIVKELTAADAERAQKGGGGWTLGIPIEGKGNKGNNPIHLGKPDVDQHGRPRPAAGAIIELVKAQFGEFLQGTLKLAEQSELIPPGPAASPDVWKRYNDRVAMRNGTAAPAGTPTPQTTYAAPANPGVTAAPANPYAPGAAPQAPAQAQQAPTAPEASSDPYAAPPPGYDPNTWGGLPAPLRQQIWTAYAQQAGQTNQAG